MTKTTAERVLDELKKGPCTAPEVAAQLGIGTKLANAYLRVLVARGIATRKRGAIPAVPRAAGNRRAGRHADLYQLKESTPWNP